MTARLVNLTPHRLRVVRTDGHILLDLAPCPHPPRVKQEIITTETLTVDQHAIPVHVIRYDATEPLPAPQADVLLVVPRVLARESHRSDLLFPDEEVRDPEGRIIACRRLARFTGPPMTTPFEGVAAR